MRSEQIAETLLQIFIEFLFERPHLIAARLISAPVQMRKKYGNAK
jgi:hypothetical protein